MQPELKPVRTDNKGFGRGTSYEPVQDVAYSNPPRARRSCATPTCCSP